jgi:hypothetical protein
MAFSIKGYVVEPVRVGTSNSPFTPTPTNIVTDQSAYLSHYTSDELVPRTDYLILVQTDGDLPDATFGWTKNETIQRFDYVGLDGHFRPLRGNARELLGRLSNDISTNSNSTRLKGAVPSSPGNSEAPYRIAVGDVGSGDEFVLSVVTSFGSPSPGTVEINKSTGEFNWNTTDLDDYNGRQVWYQRQQFYTDKESTAKLGMVSSSDLFLNPIPGSGQFPLLRLGMGFHLTPIEVVDELALSSLVVTSGQVGWARSTGKVKLNSVDQTNNATKSVFYDGVLFGFGMALPRQSSFGTINAPGVLSPVPPAGGDLIFRVPGVRTFEVVSFVTDFNPTGKQGLVEYKADGTVQFSLPDRVSLGAFSVEVIHCDLPLERGISMRFYRTPVDLQGIVDTSKDVSSIYEVEDQVMASPIIGAPLVMLPAIPLDAPGYPVTFRVDSGTGTFTGILPRLDGNSPPTGFGYRIDIEKKEFYYANRVNNKVIPATSPSPMPTPVVATDAMVYLPNLVVELETGIGTSAYTPLQQDTQYIVEPYSGTVSFVATEAAKVLSSSTGQSIAGTVTDGSVSFASVLPNDLLVVYSEPSDGVYTINTVGLSLTVSPPFTASDFTYEIRRPAEVIADRFFSEVVLSEPNTTIEKIRKLGPASNSPRLAVNKGIASQTRLRFGSTQFSTSITYVNLDSSFSTPSSLAQYAAEISLDTGNINLSQLAVTSGVDIFSVIKLRDRVDYKIDPVNGLVQFQERLLAFDEAQLSYKPAADGSVPVTERATFLVRKERTAPHPAPVSSLTFNPNGRTVATNPNPSVFRGGRPQTLGVQCVVNAATSTVTFLADALLTDALPHGAVIAPMENIYVDYFIYEAMGGENTTSALQPPMTYFRPSIVEDSITHEYLFYAGGDQTATLLPGYFIRIENEEVYHIASSTYIPGDNRTTITLSGGQEFKQTVSNPKLALSSGPVNIVDYFVNEIGVYETLPRGATKIKLTGNVTGNYRTGTIVQLVSGGNFDFYYALGSEYKPDTGQTEVTLSTSTVKEYQNSLWMLRRSIRPIFESAPKEVQTVRTPVLTQPFLVYRRSMGAAGRVLASPTDYTVDDAGKITLTSALLPLEEIGVSYTGYRIQAAGPRVRVSYTHDIAPNSSNGIANQTLTADYSLYSPDSFYFRVETLGNFKAELEAKYRSEAQSNSPGGGPRTSNGGGAPKLYEQGRESVHYEEIRLFNEDYVARLSLKFYHEITDFLDDCLGSMDGRLIGDKDGRFEFDGDSNLIIPSTPEDPPLLDSTNHIDDVIRVSNFPYTFTFPPLTINFSNTDQPAYLPGVWSRFYPTRRNKYNVCVNGKDTGAKTGNPILDIGVKKITSISNIRKRIPRALVAQDIQPSQSTFNVTDSNGGTDGIAPEFGAAMKVAFISATGTILAFSKTISTYASGVVTLTAPLGTLIPAGSTMYLDPSDTTYQKNFLIGKDLSLNADEGQLLYVEPFPPFDGTLPGLEVVEPNKGDFLQMDVTFSQTSTEPDKIPALFGGAMDDDGDTSIPIPRQPGELEELKKALTAITEIPGETTAPFVGTGNLDVTKRIITNAPGGVPTNFSSPVPRIGDLVRITSGANGITDWYIISTVTANSITVASTTGFTSVDTQFSFSVTTGTALVTSITDVSSSGSTLVDLTQNFTSLKPGYTVVFPSQLARRQIVSIVNGVSLVLDHPVIPIAGQSYRIDETLNTYGRIGSLAGSVNTLMDVLVTNDSPLVTSELLALEKFFDLVLTDIQTPASQAGTVIGSTLTSGSSFSSILDTDVDNLPDFPAFIFIRNGTNKGFYAITAVNGTQVTVETPFPTSDPVTYRLVKSFGASKQTLIGLFNLLTHVDTMTVAVTDIQSGTGPVSVRGASGVDSNIYANGVTLALLTSWEITLTNRKTELVGANPAEDGGDRKDLENILESSEKLYDKRFVWIDARINQEKGILFKQSRAVERRIKAQADTLKQLIKLLAVQGS